MENKMFFLLPMVAYSKIDGEKMLIVGWFNKSIVIRFIMLK
jgi:hypothetical protein